MQIHSIAAHKETVEEKKSPKRFALIIIVGEMSGHQVNPTIAYLICIPMDTL